VTAVFPLKSAAPSDAGEPAQVDIGAIGFSELQNATCDFGKCWDPDRGFTPRGLLNGDLLFLFTSCTRVLARWHAETEGFGVVDSDEVRQEHHSRSPIYLMHLRVCGALWALKAEVAARVVFDNATQGGAPTTIREKPLLSHANSHSALATAASHREAPAKEPIVRLLLVAARRDDVARYIRPVQLWRCYAAAQGYEFVVQTGWPRALDETRLMKEFPRSGHDYLRRGGDNKNAAAHFRIRWWRIREHLHGLWRGPTGAETNRKSPDVLITVDLDTFPNPACFQKVSGRRAKKFYYMFSVMGRALFWFFRKSVSGRRRIDALGNN
jgi:hypothetical protein